MIRQVDLISYLPQFIKDYREIKHITDAENPEFQMLSDKTEVIKDNQFIITCNEIGISKFEKLLNIVPNIDDTLEARISRVIIRWNDSIPYTYRALIERLNNLCGEGNYVVLPNFDKYELEIIASLSLSGQADELDFIITYMIPANLVVISKNKLVHNLTGTVFTGGTVVDKNYYTINSKINNEHLLERTLRFSGSVVKRNTYDFKVETNKEYILHDEVNVNSVVVTHIKREVEQ